mmetsp:Transcript_21482/g.46211  ORF Transcript_21482/g.46211 Transcript_21482/m.46211 type:complete len:250 (+) Transcript_21482:232-981(+)
MLEWSHTTKKIAHSFEGAVEETRLCSKGGADTNLLFAKIYGLHTAAQAVRTLRLRCYHELKMPESRLPVAEEWGAPGGGGSSVSSDMKRSSSRVTSSRPPLETDRADASLPRSGAAAPSPCASSHRASVAATPRIDSSKTTQSHSRGLCTSCSMRRREGSMSTVASHSASCMGSSPTPSVWMARRHLQVSCGRSEARCSSKSHSLAHTAMLRDMSIHTDCRAARRSAKRLWFAARQSSSVASASPSHGQ